jgi:biopolymer transport protein ExbD
MSFKVGGGNQPDINVTPLIDVLLVLLIIFMVVAPSKPSRFETKVPTKPQENQMNLLAPEDLLMVVIDKSQNITLNTQKMTEQELAEKLTGELENRTDKTVIVKAPKNVQYGGVAHVIDTIKGAGAEPIGLQIDFLDE